MLAVAEKAGVHADKQIESSFACFFAGEESALAAHAYC
jgi:hypothetical protein